MLFRWLDRFEAISLALLLAAMTLVTFAQVVMRYVFNDSLLWAVEFTTICFAWLIFLGIPYGVRTGSHIGVDAFVRLLKPKVGRIVAIVTVLACLAYCAIFVFGGWTYFAKLFKIGVLMNDMDIPRWIPVVIVPVGFALTFLRFSQVLWRLVIGKESRLHLADEVQEALSSDINVGGSEGERR